MLYLLFQRKFKLKPDKTLTKNKFSQVVCECGQIHLNLNLKKKTIKMLLSTKQKNSAANSSWKAFFPETLLLLTAFCYQLIPVIVWNELTLISNPVFSTILFIVGFSIVESIVFCHIWNWCKPNCKIISDYHDVKKSGQWLIGACIFVSCYLTMHGICVLFGAALTDYVQETATWALLVTCIIAVPYLCVFGSEIDPLYRVIICGKFSNSVERLLYFQTVGVVFGSWASAAVIPLDWDRVWQVWPIPGIIGCLLGYAFAVITHCILAFRETKSFSKLS